MIRLLLALLLLALPSAAIAQQKCGNTDATVKHLGEKFDEKIVWSGTTHNGIELLLFQSKAGTWTTLLVNGANACVLSVGTGGNPPAFEETKT